MTMVVKEKDELRSGNGVAGIFGLWLQDSNRWCQEGSLTLLVSGQYVLYFDFSGGEGGLRLHSGG